MKYQLVFQGQLTEAIDQAKALAIFSQLFNVSQEEARALFFSGPVKLKTFAQQKTATQYQTKLLAMGIVVTVAEIKHDTTATISATSRSHVETSHKQKSVTNELPTSTPHSISTAVTPVASRKKTGAPGGQPEPTPVTFSKKPIIWAAAAAVFVAIVGVAVSVYSSRLLDTRVPEIVDRAEALLLTPDTVALGHANVKKLVQFERLLSDTTAEDYRYNPQGNGLMNTLLKQNINLRRDLDQWVFSFNDSEEQGRYASMVLLGRIDPGALRQGLQEYYQVTEKLSEGLTILELTKEDRYTCKVSHPVSLVSNNKMVVISHPEKVVSLFQQLQTPSSPGVVNQRWVDYRSKHFASIGIFQPHNLAKGQAGLEAMMLSGLSSKLTGAQSLFAGVSAQLLPPSGSADVTLNSDDEQWVAESKNALKTALAQQQEDAEQQNELFAQLLNNLSIVGDGGALGARFEVDGELIQAGKKAFEEGISGLISIGRNSGFTSSPGNQTMTDVVDENAKPYNTQISSLELPPFEAKYGQRYHWQEGPIAVALEALRLNPQQQLELDITAVAEGIPNTPTSNGSELGQFSVTSVRAVDGRELMAQETCGNDINTDTASFSHRFQQGSLQAEKTLRLVPGADFNSIAVLEGKVLLPVTTSTKTLLVAADSDLTSPEKATIVQDGMHLRIKSIEADSVSFVVSGDQQRLLAVRGLNADKRYLQGKGSSSMGDINSGKKSVSANFQGEIAFVEVVVAVKQQPLEYRFSFKQPQPLQKSQSYAQQPQLPQPYNLADWSTVLELAKSLEPDMQNSAWLGEPLVRQRTEVGLLSLFPSEVRRGFGGYALRGYVQLDMPYVEALDGYQGRAVFSASQLNLLNHDPLMVDYEQNLLMSFKGFGNNYKNSNKTEAELRQELYLQGSQQMSIPLGEAGESLNGAQLHSIEGELQLKLPTVIASQTFDTVTLGNRLTSEGMTLQVIELAVGGIKLSAEGDTSKIMDILVLDNAGKQIGRGASFSEEMRSGLNASRKQQAPRLVSDLRFNGEVSALQVVMVTDSVIQRYPVTLSVQ